MADDKQVNQSNLDLPKVPATPQVNNILDNQGKRGEMRNVPLVTSPIPVSVLAEGRWGRKASDNELGAQIDIDSIIRRTELPSFPREISKGVPDLLADPYALAELRKSSMAREYPSLVRFLSNSERFYDHVLLALQKQEEVSPFVTKQFRANKNKVKEGALASHLETVQENRILHATLVDERTKRIIMDARQASTFSEVGEAPPEDWQRKLRMPFEWFWMEFSQPVLIGEQEYIPEIDDTQGLRVGEDSVRGILIRQTTGTVGHVTAYTKTDQDLEDKSTDEFEGYKYESLYAVTVFLTDAVGHHTRRGFLFDISTGSALTRVQSLRANNSVYEVTSEGMKGSAYWDYPEGDISEIPAILMDNPQQFIKAGHPLGMDDRHMGWWERIILSYSSLLSWLLTYMMSKGIEVTEERLPRAMRRREMKKDIPKPWHVVQVEPHLRTSGSDVEIESQQRYRQNIRYDVIGHLRCIRKKNEDGTFSNSFIWVRPHQRGLANDIYVPKTASFKAGKETHPVMNSYFTPQK